MKKVFGKASVVLMMLASLGMAMNFVSCDSPSASSGSGADFSTEGDDPTPAPVVLSSISVDTTAATVKYSLGDEFSSENVVVTAKYSDKTTVNVTEDAVIALAEDAVDEDGKLVAGKFTVTVTYEEKTATYLIFVDKDITKADAGWTGPITGGNWWTVFAGDDVSVPAFTEVSTTFTVTGVGATNWELAPDVVVRNAALVEYAVVRLDNFGWGDNYSTATLESNWNWDSIKDDVLNAEVTITVRNTGFDTVDIIYDVVKGETTHFQKFLGLKVDSSDVQINLVCENCNIEFAE